MESPCLTNHCIKCCEKTEMILLIKDIECIEELGYQKHQFVKIKDGWLQLKNKNKRCVFHTGTKCSIYHSRPIGCRLYPTIFDMEAQSAILDKDCPYKNEFSITDEDKILLENTVKKIKIERRQRKNKKKI